MKQFLVAMVLVCGAISAGRTQSKTVYGQSDPQAKALLDAVSKKFKTYRDVKADFVMKVQGDDNKVSDSKKGSVFLKGTKYKILIAGQEIYCDGKTTWTYNKDADEVQVNNYEPDSNTISPSKLFTNFYDKDFLYRMNKSTRENGKILEVIEMTPLNKSKPFFKVVVYVDKANKNILRTTVFEKGGNRYTYEVSRFSPDIKMDDSLFVFDPKLHPKADVVDLR